MTRNELRESNSIAETGRLEAERKLAIAVKILRAIGYYVGDEPTSASLAKTVLAVLLK